MGLGKLKRGVEGVVAGALHPVRRRRARRRLRAAGDFSSYLFICHGNIYRSPFAQYLFESRLAVNGGGPAAITSAGFVGPGRTSPAKALQLAAELGVDMSPHRSCTISYDRIQEGTLVVVMEPEQERAIRMRTKRGHVLVLGDLDPQRITSRTIVDPWNQGDTVLAASYARVERCVDVLVREVGQ